MTALSLLDLVRVTAGHGRRPRAEQRPRSRSSCGGTGATSASGLPSTTTWPASPAPPPSRRDRPRRRRHHDDPRRRRRHHAAQPRALVIAEQFGTLEPLFPGRIDLGLGRAPGTDQRTLRALRRAPEAADTFPQDVLELQAFFAPAAPGPAHPGRAGRRTDVPLWILGSSNFGAHAGGRARPAVRLRLAFRTRLAAAGAARSTAAASSRPSSSTGPTRWSASTSSPPRPTRKQSASPPRSRCPSPTSSAARRGLSQPPIDDIETYWSPHGKGTGRAHAGPLGLRLRHTVRAGIDALVAETGADELMIVSDVYDHAERGCARYELIAEATKTRGWRDDHSQFTGTEC